MNRYVLVTKQTKILVYGNYRSDKKYYEYVRTFKKTHIACHKRNPDTKK